MTLTESLFVIFAIIAIGIICEKRKFFNSVQIEGFEIFLFKIAMPCYLFTSTSNHDLTTLFHPSYISSFMLAFFIITVIVALYFRNKPWPETIVRIFSCGYVNSAVYSLPIIIFLLDDPEGAILVTLMQLTIIQVIFITTLGAVTHKDKNIFIKLLSAILNPLTISTILGLVCNYLEFKPNICIISITESIGNGATSIALFSFGLSLGDVKFNKKIISKEVVELVFIKNILHPIIACFIGKYFFSLENYWLSALIITSSSPTAFIVYIIAKKYSIDQDLAKRVIALSSIISLITLIIIAYMI